MKIKACNASIWPNEERLYLTVYINKANKKSKANDNEVVMITKKIERSSSLLDQEN